jgi:hypothetical protein
LDSTNNILDPAPEEAPPDSKREFLRGTGDVLLFYIIGLFLAALSYFIAGHEYAHAPALYHFVILLTFAIGLIWAIGSILKYIIGSATWRTKGVIFANTIALLIFVAVIYTIVHEETEPDREPGREITVSTNGDTTTVYHYQNIVFMKVKDSVLLNFIDSAKLEEVLKNASK